MTGARFRAPAGSTSCPGRIRPVSEFSRCPPAVPDYSQSGPRARGVTSWPGRLTFWSEFSRYQLSWSTRVRVRVPKGSISCPVQLGPVSEVPWVDQLSRTSRAGVRGPAGSTRIPGRLGPGSKGLQGQLDLPDDSGPCSKSCRVELISRANQACVQGPRPRSDVPGDLAPCLSCCGVDQLSWMTPACV